MNNKAKNRLRKALQYAYDNAENTVEEQKIDNVAFELGIKLISVYEEDDYYINSIVGS